MANKFVTFLEDIGKDFKNGLIKLEPFLIKGIAIAEAAEAPITAINPLVGAIFQTVVGTVSSIEQKFAAMGTQTGTGAQKLAEAVQILAPVLGQALTAAGHAADLTTVQNYINAVVAFLNAIPAPVAAVVATNQAPS